MQVTRRYWAIAGLGGFLTGLALLLARPFLLVGAAGVAAWLLAKQYAFVRALTRTVDELTVEQSVPRERIAAGIETTGQLRAELPAASPLTLAIEAQPPVTATSSPRPHRTLTVERGTREAMTEYPLTWSVAGSFTFDQPTITATDADGLFGEQLAHGSTPEVVVESRSPSDIHVGAGGERSQQAYGEHESVQRASGLDPAELREYIPGDPAQRIDWKATARMNQPHVREYEAEIDYVTALLFDHRSAMGHGPDGGTKLDYARQVALAFADSTREANDPLGYYAVGEDGYTDRREPAVGQYEQIKRRLRELQPADSDETSSGPTAHPLTARSVAATLNGTDTFDSTLRPYFATVDHHTDTPQDNPLFETVRTHLTQRRGSLLTVIFTDDTHQAEVRETVRIARRKGDRVVVFLTPSVLFDSDELADLETAYDRYQDFEKFRRQLTRLDRVSAFEVGPGDRLDAVLSVGKRRRSNQSRNQTLRN